jgi:BTB/POZ domain
MKISAERQWNRSGNYLTDQLHFFESGEHYDCTLSVGSKLYKCHKLVLSVASGVFEAMFFGDFAESTKGRDEPIDLKDVSVEAFECAIK